ncbi:MAG: XRE family transcriptional regulator [Candidatus Adiutricales bacterium]
MKKKNVGSNFDDFLEEEGIFEEVQETALKRVLAFQVQKAMEEKNLSKTEMAKKMNTSRSALDRLLNPDNDSVTLQTMKKAAHAVGRRLTFRLV